MNKEAIKKSLTDSSNVTLKKFRAELAAQCENIMEQSLRKFRTKVARRANFVSQKWCKWSEEAGPVLMPDRVRLYYRRGNTEVVLQEIPPQVRQLRFVPSLAKRNSTSELIPEDSNVYGYSLALPYMNFIYRFKDGILDKTLLSFCDRPLKNLKEQPLKPFLSNVNTDLRVCHGRQHSVADLEKNNIAQQIAYTQDLFWQTVYKDEWSNLFWQYKSWFQDRDPRMSSFESWEESSLDNPLFVIEDVDWMTYSDNSYGVLIVRMFDHDTIDAQFQQDLFDDLVDNFLDELKEVVTAKMKNIDETIPLESVIEEETAKLFQKLS